MTEATRRDEPDLWPHLGRGLVYWFVTVMALTTGNAYRGRGLTPDDGMYLGLGLTPNTVLLITFSLLLLPFFQVYAAVFDQDWQPQDPGGNFYERNLKGLENAAWIITLVVTHGLVLAMAVLLPFISGLAQTLTAVQWGYFGVLYFIHFYYGVWLLRKRGDPSLRRARNETFIPVLILAFSFFFGATYQDASPFLYAWPATVFVCVGLLHFLDRATTGGIGPRAYFWTTFVYVPVSVLLPFLSDRLGAVSNVTASYWAGTLLVAFSLCVYLSLFEAWKLTAFAATTTASEQVGPHRTSSRDAHYGATLVAHAGALVLLPLIFVFGTLGPTFLWCSLLHGVAAFVLWYRKGPPQAWRKTWWPWAKLVFGFGVFFLVFVDLLVSSEYRSSTDYFPSNLTDLSASILAAVLLGFLATPFVQYLTDKGRHRTFRELLSDFFALDRPAVFRLGAVFSGILLVCTDFLYEGATSFALDNIRFRSSSVFWLYTAFTVAFGVLAFFLSPSTGGSGRDSTPPQKSAAGLWLLLSTLQGVASTLRIVTGTVVFLGVVAVGIVSDRSALAILQMGLSVSLVAMASFAINDYYDVAKDRINAPSRAIPSGRLSSRQTLTIGLAALTCGVIVGLGAVEGIGAMVFLIGAFGGAVYNEIVRRWPASKGIVTAALCALILVYDVAVFDLPMVFMWAAAACFVFVVGRELLMDVRDEEGDRASGLRTPAVLLGRGAATRIGFGLLVMSAAPLIVFLSSRSSPTIAWAALGFYIMSIVVMGSIWVRGDGREAKDRAILFSRVSLLLGVLVLST